MKICGAVNLCKDFKRVQIWMLDTAEIKILAHVTVLDI
jgi:hypothetical protein